MPLKELNRGDTKTQSYTLCFSVPLCLCGSKMFSRITFRWSVRRNKSSMHILQPGS